MENILHLSLAYASFLLYKKMDFCARACDAARDVGPMVRGSERKNMFTSCLADSRLEQVDMIFLRWITSAQDFDFWVTAGTETIDANGVFSVAYLFVESRL